jgi:hypothetical protein
MPKQIQNEANMRKSPLVFVSRGAPTPDEFRRAMSEISSGSDRAVALVGGAILETTLTDTLKVFLHRKKKITDDLFRPSGACGAFATKIHLGFLIGLYGEDAHRELTIMKDIRNQFAHSLQINDFNTEKIRAWTANLKMCESRTDDTSKPPSDGWFSVSNRDELLKQPKERYVITVQVLTYGLVIPAHTGMPSPLF